MRPGTQVRTIPINNQGRRGGGGSIANGPGFAMRMRRRQRQLAVPLAAREARRVRAHVSSLDMSPRRTIHRTKH